MVDRPDSEHWLRLVTEEPIDEVEPAEKTSAKESEPQPDWTERLKTFRDGLDKPFEKFASDVRLGLLGQRLPLDFIDANKQTVYLYLDCPDPTDLDEYGPPTPDDYREDGSLRFRGLIRLYYGDERYAWLVSFSPEEDKAILRDGTLWVDPDEADEFVFLPGDEIEEPELLDMLIEGAREGRPVRMS